MIGLSKLKTQVDDIQWNCCNSNLLAVVFKYKFSSGHHQFKIGYEQNVEISCNTNFTAVPAIT